VHLLATLPLRANAGAAFAEHRRLWADRQRLRAELVGLERRTAAWRQFAVAVGGEGALSGLRQRLLAAVDVPGVSGVRLEVRPARPPASAVARLAAEGEFDAILELLTRLARPDTGFGMSSVRIGAGRAVLSLQLEGFVPEAGP
jgi:hypothetical protein